MFLGQLPTSLLDITLVRGPMPRRNLPCFSEAAAPTLLVRDRAGARAGGWKPPSARPCPKTSATPPPRPRGPGAKRGTGVEARGRIKGAARGPSGSGSVGSAAAGGGACPRAPRQHQTKGIRDSHSLQCTLLPACRDGSAPGLGIRGFCKAF